jgi:hypothetical protein
VLWLHLARNQPYPGSAGRIGSRLGLKLLELGENIEVARNTHIRGNHGGVVTRSTRSFDPHAVRGLLNRLASTAKQRELLRRQPFGSTVVLEDALQFGQSLIQDSYGVVGLFLPRHSGQFARPSSPPTHIAHPRLTEVREVEQAERALISDLEFPLVDKLPIHEQRDGVSLQR